MSGWTAARVAVRAAWVWLLLGALAGWMIGHDVGVSERPAVHLPPECEVFEDGSSRCPEGTFAWDCETMGNRVCGRDKEE